MNIVFVLPVKGGGGGAHSVAQEVNELNKMGVNAKIAVNSKNFTKFCSNYADLPFLNGRIVEFSNVSDLANLMEGNDVVIATIFTSVKLVEEALTLVKVKPGKVGYYIQDYEPMFSAPDSDLWQEAYESYTRIKDMKLFAKTDWIRKIVSANHDVKVNKVSPSIDHDVYVPCLSKNGPAFRISAMIRPATPRRAPARTMQLLHNIKQKYGNSVQVDIFGCTDAEIEDGLFPSDFEFNNHGVLLRSQVSSLLQKSHLFIDLSDYQAFGRTGLEAMACGAVSLVPATGGADEYAIHMWNALMIDPRDLNLCETHISNLIDSPDLYNKLKANAMITSLKYSVRSAALSIVQAVA